MPVCMKAANPKSDPFEKPTSLGHKKIAEAAIQLFRNRKETNN